MSVSGTYWPPNLPKRPNLSGRSIPRTLAGAGGAAPCAVASRLTFSSLSLLLALVHVLLAALVLLVAQGHRVLGHAVLLALHLYLRPVELQGLRWSQFAATLAAGFGGARG